MRLSRIIIDILLISAVFWLPWWMTFILGASCIFLFDSYYEFILMSLITDSLYGVSAHHFYGIRFVVTIGALLVFVILNSLRKKLRFYR